MEKNFYEEYVTVNGIEQYMLHYQKKEGTPVLLYLHGGPGASEHALAYILDQAWNNMFTMVQWDQRGSGRTLKKNRNTDNPESVKQMLSDLHNVIEYLKKKYSTDKIVILGHSWGSMLGSLYTLQQPENVAAYIGSGQMISTMENERIMYQKLIKQAKELGNEKQLKQLQKIGEYPTDDIDEVLRKLPTIHKMAMHYTKEKSDNMLLKKMKSSPCFKFSDLLDMLKSSKANQKLIKDVFSYDLNKDSKNYEVPVYYILGADDNTTPTDLAIKYFETINAKKKLLTVIPDTGHNLMYEQPELYAQALRKVINDLNGIN